MSKQKRPSLVRRDKFDDGSAVDTPLAEIIEQQLRQFCAMASSDSPRLRVEGRQLLKQAAQFIANTAGDQFLRTIANRKNASKTRETAKLPDIGTLREEWNRIEREKGPRNVASLLAARYGTTADAVRKKAKKKNTT